MCQELHEKWLRETGGDKKKVAKYKNCLNPPLLANSFPNSRIRYPLMHITTGLGVHDIGKLEGEILNFDETAAPLHLDPDNKEGPFWNYIRYKKMQFKLTELNEKLKVAKSKQARQLLKQDIDTVTKDVQSLFGKEVPKLTKKTSFMMKLFNRALTKNRVHREKYWSCTFTGNAINKFIHNVEPIFEDFNTLIDSHYIADTCQTSFANPDLTTQCNRYTLSIIQFPL